MLKESVEKLLPEGVAFRKVIDHPAANLLEIVLSNGEFSAQEKIPCAYDESIVKEAVDKCLAFFKSHGEKMAKDKAERQSFIAAVKKVKEDLIENN